MILVEYCHDISPSQILFEWVDKNLYGGGSVLSRNLCQLPTEIDQYSVLCSVLRVRNAVEITQLTSLTFPCGIMCIVKMFDVPSTQVVTQVACFVY